MIAQYLYEIEGEIEHCMCEIKGTKEQEEYAKFLWGVTYDLSELHYHHCVYKKKDIEDILYDEYMYDEEDINKTLEFYPDLLVSVDVISAYEEYMFKLRELGMKAKWIDKDYDEVDVWTSTGVY